MREMGRDPETIDTYRAALADGRFAALLSGDAPGQKFLTDGERADSLRATLAARPAGDLWIFGYGSLIWNAALRVAERRVARIVGWHRAFCLAAPHGRGSPERPGLVLALEPGGSCKGVALRIAEPDIRAELDLLWRREMVATAYIPRWIDLYDGGAQPFGAGLTFTIDTAASHYARDPPYAETVTRLATARGSLGSAADYLFMTRDGLRTYDIFDATLERLADDVAARLG